MDAVARLIFSRGKENRGMRDSHSKLCIYLSVKVSAKNTVPMKILVNEALDGSQKIVQDLKRRFAASLLVILQAVLVSGNFASCLQGAAGDPF